MPRRRATVAYGARKAAFTAGSSAARARVVSRKAVCPWFGGEHAARRGHAQRERQCGAVGVVDGGVEGDHGGQAIAVLDGPAERDGPAPVVTDGHDRTPDADPLDETRRDRRSAGRACVAGTSAPRSPSRAGRPRPRARRRHRPRRGRGRRSRAHATGRTTWDCRARRRSCRSARDRARRGRRRCRARATGAWHPHRRGRRRRSRGATGPGRARAGPRGKSGLGSRDARKAHQASSSMPVFKPEPTPIRRTRSPRRSVFCSAARVIGIEAGPTLPRFG